MFLEYAKRCENITNYTAILTLSYTGLRRGELTGLKWEDVDLEAVIPKAPKPLHTKVSRFFYNKMKQENGQS